MSETVTGPQTNVGKQQLEEIRDRLRLAFSSSYLTLLSIIQGTALAVLFGKIDHLIQGPLGFGASQALMALALFLLIVLIWNQYQMGVMLYNWTPKLLDSFIPFTFGLCEFTAILGLERGFRITLLTLGAMFVLGIVAFEYQYAQVQKSSELTNVIHRVQAGFRRVDDLSCVASSVLLFLTSAIVWRTYGTAASFPILASAVVIVIAIGHGVRQAIHWHFVQLRLQAATS